MASCQNKIKSLHPQLAKTQPTQEILKKIPSKYLTPKLFLSLQQKNLQISFQPSKKEFQPKSYCNKYFGQKVLYVSDSQNMNKAMGSCKLFQRIKLDKNILSKEGFKAAGDLLLIGKETPIKMNQITKIVRECKGKISIVVSRNKYRYNEEEMLQRRSPKNPIKYNFNVWIKKLMKNCNVNLQSLSLVFQSVDQFPILKRILRNLRHLCLKFDKEFGWKCGWKIDPPLDYTFKTTKDKFFKFILQLVTSANKLQTLRLDLAPYCIASNPLAYLLLIFNYYEIPDCYMRVGVVSEDFMKIVNGINIKEIDKMTPVGLKSTSEVLKTVNFLGLYVVNYLEKIDDEFAFDKYEDYGAFRRSVLRLGEMPEVTCKYKRILDVTLTDFSLETISSFRPTESEKWTVDLKAILSHFPELQGLYIKAVENVVTFEDNEQKSKKKSHGKKKTNILPEELRWTINLHEVFISFLSLRGTNELNFESKTESFSNFMEVLKTRCPQLASLNVFRGHPLFDWDGQMTICTKNRLTIPCEEITGMSNLRELEIYSDNKGLKSIEKTLETLKSLEKLKINIDNNDLHRTFFDFLAERHWERRFYDFDEKEKMLCSLSGIKELELIISQSGYSIKWADHFARYIGSLKSLEVLKVVDGNKDEIRLEVLMKIVDGLSRKRTLRSVEIDCVIVQNDPTLEFAAEFLNNDVSKGEVEELAIKILEAKIVQMMELNLGLELVEIKDFKGMTIERILYDTRYQGDN